MFKSLLATSLICLALTGASAQTQVEQWGIFEVALTGPTNGNPFLDTSFFVRFWQSNDARQVTGFYDGDGIYRARFMPERQGAWNYSTVSSAPELNGKTGTFMVTNPPPQDHGPVRVANTYHFAYADGTPYKELGTTCYVWAYQREEVQAQTLQTLATAPFNKVRMCVFPTHNDTNEPPLFPFEGKPATNWDFARFNPKFFQHFEQRILALQKLGIEADVILFHPYDAGHWGFDRMPPYVDDRYARYLVARLSAYRNVWWSLANEWDFVKAKQESDFVRIGELVAYEDPYHHLLSIHNGMKLFNYALPWITHASIQNGQAVENPASAEMYRDVYGKPVVYDEVKYEGNLSRRWGNLSAEELVYRFWNGTVAGTYVGHGETYASTNKTSTNSVVAWTRGGVLRGQSPARLAFLKQVLDDAPPEGIEPLDKWQNPEYGGQPGKYYLIYLGKSQPSSWTFLLPSPPMGDGVALEDGMTFKAEVLDTWNMTISPVPGEFVLKRKDAYFFTDRDGRAINLPAKPYLAIRIKRVKYY